MIDRREDYIRLVRLHIRWWHPASWHKLLHNKINKYATTIPLLVNTAVLPTHLRTSQSQQHQFTVKGSFLVYCRTERLLTNSVFLNNLYSVWRSHFKLAWLLYLMGLITMVITQDHILVNNCFVIAFRLHNNDTVHQFLSLHNYRGCLIIFRINMHSFKIMRTKWRILIFWKKGRLYCAYSYSCRVTQSESFETWEFIQEIIAQWYTTATKCNILLTSYKWSL